MFEAWGFRGLGILEFFLLWGCGLLGSGLFDVAGLKVFLVTGSDMKSL